MASTAKSAGIEMRPNTVFTRKEAAEYMRVSINTIAAYMRRAENPLPFFKVGTRKILIPTDQLKEWIAAEVERTREAV